MMSNISSDMNKPCWKLAKACPQSQIQILHHDHYLLVPCSHLSIGICDAQSVRQVGTISLLQGLHHHVHVAAQEHGLSFDVYDL